jgi:hypothetical protein
MITKKMAVSLEIVGEDQMLRLHLMEPDIR